jgi:cytochrome c oxidase cbb3-type subunit 1
MRTAPGTSDRPPVNLLIVKQHLVAAVVFFTLALFAGLLYSAQFLQAYPFKNTPWLSPGRVRMVHTNLIAYGFICNAFLGGMYWAVPRLTGVSVYSDKFATLIFRVWQAVVVATFVGLLCGQAQAVTWGETPIWVDPVVVFVVILVAVQFLYSIIKTPVRSRHVTLGYFSVALLWAGPIYIMGNYTPQFLVPGTDGAVIIGWFTHHLVGLFVTSIGWGLMYFFLPVMLKKSIHSDALSRAGLWGLVFFYPMLGILHVLGSLMFARYVAVISTLGIEILVSTVIVNFFLTLRGHGAMLKTNIPIRWFTLGMVFYFMTSLQRLFQVSPTYQALTRFTDWGVGQSHLVMFGVFGFWMLGMVTHLWPMLVGADWYSDTLDAWTFWLSGLGMFVMFFDLVTAGLVQGFLWRSLAPWEDSVVVSMPFWYLRAFAGGMIVVGNLLFVANMILTARGRTRPHGDTEYVAASA